MVDWILWRCQMPDAQTLPRVWQEIWKKWFIPKPVGKRDIYQNYPDVRAQEKERSTTATWWLFSAAGKMLLPICLEKFNLLFLSLQTFQQHFPLGKFTESNDTTFLDRRGISPGVAPPCRAGRHGGEVVGKPSLKKHRRSLSTSQKTQGAGSKFGSNIVFLQKGRNYD